MQKTGRHLPHVRVLGLDVDGTLANTAVRFSEYAARTYHVYVSIREINRLGGISAAYGPRLRPEHMQDCLAAPWRDPDSIELTDPKIPDYLRQIDGPYSFVNVGLSASKGKTEAIKRWMRGKEIPFEDFIHVEKQSQKSGCGIDVQAEDSMKATLSFIDSGIPVIFIRTETNGNGAETLKGRPGVFVAKWEEVPKIMSSEPALIRRLDAGIGFEPALSQAFAKA